jgi:hypothetical protein
MVAVFAFVIHRRGVRVTCVRVVSYAAIYLALMSPWWVHNYQKYDHFVRLNLGDGLVLYAGNNPMNRSGGGITGIDVDLSVAANYTPDGPSQYDLNERLKGMAWHYIRENPARFAELATLKFMRFWRLWPHTQEYNRPAIAVLSIMSYGMVLFLALFCLYQEFPRHWRSLSPLLLFGGYLTLVHMVTIGSIRYRFPIEPFLIILAARGAANLARSPLLADRLSARRVP